MLFPAVSAPAQTGGEELNVLSPTAESAPLAADETPPPVATSQSGDSPGLGSGLPLSGFDIIWNIGVFLLVLALLYLALKALGRASRFKGLKGGRQSFTLRGIQPLDNRKYLAAVEIEGRLIVVGVSPERITPVAHWFLDEEDESDALDLTSSASPHQEAGLDLKLPDEDDSPSFDLGLGGSSETPGQRSPSWTAKSGTFNSGRLK